MSNRTFSRILTVSQCRAFLELKDRTPLTDEEWSRLYNLIQDCGLKGTPFDEVSYLYPLLIPNKPRVQILQENPRVVSVSTLYDRNQFVGVVGDRELEEFYLDHEKAFLYAVGKLEKCRKNDKEYLNLRPRGWVIVEVVPVKDEKEPHLERKDEEKVEKKKKR